jgi:iron(III) transport system substrate-binding protein
VDRRHGPRARRRLLHGARVAADELPTSIFDITDEQYRGRVGYAPTNGSFQAFVTAMRISEGEDVARQWMEDLLANDPQVYQNNSSQLEAIARGEIDFAITNHYYLYRFLAEDPNFPVDNHYLPGDIGGLVNVAGVGIVDTTSRPNAPRPSWWRSCCPRRHRPTSGR